MLVYIMDTCSSITIEQESKNLTDKVVMDLTFFHILVALSASVKAFLLATFADFTPRCFIVFLASWTFAIEEFLAGSAI